MIYSKAWTKRNEIMHNPEVYRQYVIGWNRNIKKMIMNGDKPEMREYLRTYPIEVETCKNSYIRRWNLAARTMYKEANKEVLQDIRMYFQRSLS